MREKRLNRALGDDIVIVNVENPLSASVQRFSGDVVAVFSDRRATNRDDRCFGRWAESEDRMVGDCVAGEFSTRYADDAVSLHTGEG